MLCLDIGYTQIVEIDTTPFYVLEHLYIIGSLVKKFSTKSLGRLTRLVMYYSKVESVDAEPLLSLDYIDVSYTPIVKIDLRCCKKLTEVDGCN